MDLLSDLLVREYQSCKFCPRYISDDCSRSFSNARTSRAKLGLLRDDRTLYRGLLRTMLADSHLPTTFWAEAVNTACYTFNRVTKEILDIDVQTEEAAELMVVTSTSL
ncbi:hypothetical protein Tco_1509770 [Tanacetum coccineum]